MTYLQIDEIRKRVWHSISFQTAAQAGDGMTQADIQSFIAGTFTPSDVQLTWLAPLPRGEAMSGLQIIREAVLARKSVMAIMARDCGVSLMLLDAFSQGLAELPADNLDLVVKFCWNSYVEYNAEADALQPVAQPEARSIGVRPTWSIDIPKLAPGSPPHGGPQPEVAAPVKSKQRPGWIGGVWE